MTRKDKKKGEEKKEKRKKIKPDDLLKPF